MDASGKSIMAMVEAGDSDALDACLRQSLRRQYPLTPEHRARAWNSLRAAAEQQAAAMHEQAERVENAENSPLSDAITEVRLPTIFTALFTGLLTGLPILAQSAARALSDALACALSSLEAATLNTVETWLLNDTAYKRAGARSTSFGTFGGSFGYAYPAALGRLSFA